MLRKKLRKLHEFFTTNKKELKISKAITYKIQNQVLLIIFLTDFITVNARIVLNKILLKVVN